jgi:NAD(P)-dependent dehydrogenase (short-subunit alcohol dehydrogenase family)
VNLEGRVALVTGASRGIGSRTAVELASKGAAVVIAARTLEPGARTAGSLTETAQVIRAAGADVLTVACDLNQSHLVADLAAAALAWKGRVDVLVNNAAFLGRATFHSLDELTLQNWQRQLNVNVTAPLMLSKALAPGMRTAGAGVIVNVTSNAAEMYEGIVPGVPYGATKAALNRLTLAMARDLRPHGVSVFAVDPGHVRTEVSAKAAQHPGWHIDIDEAHPPAVAAAAIADLVGRDCSEVSGRIWGAVASGRPVLLHDGRGAPPDLRWGRSRA